MSGLAAVAVVGAITLAAGLTSDLTDHNQTSAQSPELSDGTDQRRAEPIDPAASDGRDPEPVGGTPSTPSEVVAAVGDATEDIMIAAFVLAEPLNLTEAYTDLVAGYGQDATRQFIGDAGARDDDDGWVLLRVFFEGSSEYTSGPAAGVTNALYDFEQATRRLGYLLLGPFQARNAAGDYMALNVYDRGGGVVYMELIVLTRPFPRDSLLADPEADPDQTLRDATDLYLAKAESLVEDIKAAPLCQPTSRTHASVTCSQGP